MQQNKRKWNETKITYSGNYYTHLIFRVYQENATERRRGMYKDR